MPHASTVSEPKKDIVVAPKVTVNVAPSASDIHAFRTQRESRLQAQFDHRLNPPKQEPPDISNFQPVDIMSWPDSFFISVIASRRSGKSFLVNWALQQFQQSKRRFSTIFLISPTDSGFEGIPKKYRFKDLSQVQAIVNQQREVMRHNKKVKYARDRVISRVCVVIDDCACSAVENLRQSQVLEEMAMNGRHIGHPLDTEPGNGVSFFVLSQSLTRISRAVRLNLDCFIFNNLSSCKEAEMILDECFFLNTRRDAKREARDKYEALVTSKDYRFICVENFVQNTRQHEDYIKLIDATEEKDFQLFGTLSDNEDSDEECDKQFRTSGPKTISGGRLFYSGGTKFAPHPY